MLKDDTGIEIQRIDSRPSGPQQAGSPILAALVDQLSFSTMVADFATHVLIPTVTGTVELDASVEAQIEKKRRRPRGAARTVCGEPGRTPDPRRCRRQDPVPGEGEAARLRRRMDLSDTEDPALATLLDLIDGPDALPVEVATAIVAMEAAGHDRSQARTIVNECVASGFVGCDLTSPFDDRTILRRLFDSLHDRRDPILVAIMAARPG